MSLSRQSIVLVLTRAFQFAIHQFVLGESIRFVKKSAIRFGRCICLINDHTPWHSPILRCCISHSTVQLILLTLHNIYWLVLLLWSCESDSWWLSRVDIWQTIVACTVVMCWIESNRKNLFVSEKRIESEYFFLNRNALVLTTVTEEEM